ncbi:hypothetical protein [Thauera sp.]|uniref:hypothetical protein n=1 Tax=Thauera sp. TaxID=1905334 RepID=UPI0039E2869C
MSPRHGHNGTAVTPVRAPQDTYPPRSLLGVGVLARLGAAVLATGLLWLTVLWALD